MTTRYVDHVMGMPISLAVRGRHAADARARTAWADVMASLRWVDRVFSTYRAESFVSRLGRGEVEVADCPPEVAEVLELGDLAEQRSGGAFRVRRAGADGEVVLDPSGVVKGWAVERASAHLEALPDTDFCLSAGG
ncbi:MAG TPA: FAD:protein FMN transferase, partial [Umezawaea sp.]|nr:FAD:protein FMN transferase [Umezawaea sp.]